MRTRIAAQQSLEIQTKLCNRSHTHPKLERFLASRQLHVTSKKIRLVPVSIHGGPLAEKTAGWLQAESSHAWFDQMGIITATTMSLLLQLRRPQASFWGAFCGLKRLKELHLVHRELGSLLVPHWHFQTPTSPTELGRWRCCRLQSAIVRSLSQVGALEKGKQAPRGPSTKRMQRAAIGAHLRALWARRLSRLCGGRFGMPRAAFQMGKIPSILGEMQSLEEKALASS